MDNLSENNKPQDTTANPQKPNELGGFDISGVVKIYDPETKEVYVEVRT